MNILRTLDSLHTRSLIVAGLSAGLAMGLISVIPLVNCLNWLACMWVWTGGIFATWHYRRLSGLSSPLTGEQGALIGLLSGAIGFVSYTILMIVFVGILGAYTMAVEQGINAEGGFVLGGLTLWIMVPIAFFAFPIFGTIGGAIGSQILNKRNW